MILLALRRSTVTVLQLSAAGIPMDKLGVPGASEEIVRQFVYNAIEGFASGGGYVCLDFETVGTTKNTQNKFSGLKTKPENIEKIL